MADDGTPLTALLNPLTPLRLGLRALDDLHAVASVARQDPNPQVALRDALEEARQDISELLAGLRTLILRIEGVTTTATVLDGHAVGLDGTANELISGGRELTDTAKDLDGVAKEIHEGGQDLTETAKMLDRHTVALLAIAQSFEGHLPAALKALDSVESLEDSVETVAETVEPLQGTAERMGRITKRLGGGGSS